MVQRLGSRDEFFQGSEGFSILLFWPFFWGGELMVLMVFYQKEIKLCEFFWSSSFFFLDPWFTSGAGPSSWPKPSPKKNINPTSWPKPSQLLTELDENKLDFFYQWFNRFFFVKKGHMNFLISKWWLIWISNLPHSAKQGDATHEFLRSIFLNHFFSMKDL